MVEYSGVHNAIAVNEEFKTRHRCSVLPCENTIVYEKTKPNYTTTFANQSVSDKLG